MEKWPAGLACNIKEGVQTMEAPPPNIAKITRPKALHLLDRPRLFAALDRARQGAATWVTAPPGFGKTSLASSYVAHCGLDCVWYRADEEDADVGNFFCYLTQAGETLRRHDGNLPTFTPEDLPSVGAFARRFFERLCARLQPPAIIVFDDYEDGHASCQLHALLASVVEHLPEHIHVLFLSREKMPAAFARLRGHGGITHIDADALRLTQDEAQAFAASKQIQPVDKEAAFRLNELVGGWAAGLQLLLERGSLPIPNTPPNATTFQAVFDYFSQEVFLNLDPSVQTMLATCAVLPKMPIDVMAQLADAPDAVLVLDKLSASNCFTARHDGHVAVYEFHPLFRAFLLQQAIKTNSPEQFTMLQQKAANILARFGYIEDASLLMQACGDWPSLTEIILFHAPKLARQGRLQTIELWIRRVPDPIVEVTPWLLYWLGACQLPCNPADAQVTLLRAYALFDAESNSEGLYLCWTAIASTYRVAWFPPNESAAWISIFEALRVRYPDFSSPAIEATVALGAVSMLRLYRLGDSQLPLWLNRCRNSLETIDDDTTRLLAANELAWCYFWLGRNREGAALLRELAPWVTPETAPMAQLNWLTAKAMYAWLEADVTECANIVALALRTADESDIHVLDLFVCVFGVYGTLTVGDSVSASALLRRVERNLPTPRNVNATAYNHIQTLIGLHAGDYLNAEQHARHALAYADAAAIVFLHFLCRLCLASVLVELGKLEEAAEQFEGASRVAEGVNSDVMAHLTLLGTALLEFKRGRHAKSLALLRGAIEKAKAIGGHYTPIYHRESLAALYAMGLEANLEVEFLQTIIRRQRLLPQAAESTPENWPWPVRIYTLGRFAVAKDGPSVETHSKASRKPIELLKALIAHGGRAVHQDNFLTALWPDSDGDDAQHALETAVYRLRKLLGAEALIVRDSSLTLNHQHCWVDCWAFERLISSTYRGIDDGDTAAVTRDVRKLLNLYQGPFLNRDQETAAATVYGERLRSRLLRALERLGQYWAATGDGTKTLECYLYALEVDPSAEVFYQRLMRHYHAEGRHAETIAVYQRCRLTLQALVGVSPCADTVNLHASTVAAASAHSQSPEASKC